MKQALDNHAPIRVLHLVRRGADCFPLRVAERGGADHALLLYGDGVYNGPPRSVRTFFAAECARRREVAPPGEPLEDAAIVELLARADKVVGW